MHRGHFDDNIMAICKKIPGLGDDNGFLDTTLLYMKTIVAVVLSPATSFVYGFAVPSFHS